MIIAKDTEYSRLESEAIWRDQRNWIIEEKNGYVNKYNYTLIPPINILKIVQGKYLRFFLFLYLGVWILFVEY